MLEVKRDDFDESLEDIMKSLNSILKNTGEGFETKEENLLGKDGKEKKC